MSPRPKWLIPPAFIWQLTFKLYFLTKRHLFLMEKFGIYVHFKSVLFTFINGTSCHVWFCWAVWCKPNTVGYLKTRDKPLNMYRSDIVFQQEIRQHKCAGKTVVKQFHETAAKNWTSFFIISLRNTPRLRCHLPKRIYSAASLNFVFVLSHLSKHKLTDETWPKYLILPLSCRDKRQWCLEVKSVDQTNTWLELRFIQMKLKRKRLAYAHKNDL